MPNDSTLPEMQKKGIILGVVLENLAKSPYQPRPEVERRVAYKTKCVFKSSDSFLISLVLFAHLSNENTYIQELKDL